MNRGLQATSGRDGAKAQGLATVERDCDEPAVVDFVASTADVAAVVGDVATGVAAVSALPEIDFPTVVEEVVPREHVAHHDDEHVEQSRQCFDPECWAPAHAETP